MSCITIATRGSSFIFTAVPRDVDGEIVSPMSVTLYMNYRHNNTVTDVAIAMVQQVDQSWVATWDSDVADSGNADWCVRSEGSPRAAEQGELVLRANRANPGT